MLEISNKKGPGVGAPDPGLKVIPPAEREIAKTVWPHFCSCYLAKYYIETGVDLQ